MEIDTQASPAGWHPGNSDQHLMQYRERPKPRSTAAPAPCLILVRRAAARLAVALLASVPLGTGLLANCAKQPLPPEPAEVTRTAEIPASVLLAEQAPPFYSLQPSADGRHWIAVFADAADLTLRLARGSLDAGEAHVDELFTIDRIDIVPGINPYFGRHAYLQHEGIEHLFYTDQELSDARVTKWIYRPVDRAGPWTVDLLPEPVLPVAVLPAPAAGSEHPGFTLFGMRSDAGENSVLAYEVRPHLLPEDSAPISGGTPTELVDSAADGASAPGPTLNAYHCAERHGLSMAADTGVLLFEVVGNGSTARRITLPPRTERTSSAPLLLSVGCGSMELVVAYARDDRKALETSPGAARGAHEIVAVAIGDDGEVNVERKVTLARDVRALAVFPAPAVVDTGDRAEGAERPVEATAPKLIVLFSELALVDGSGEPQYRLSLVAPDTEGTYRKSPLAHGSAPVQDVRALRAGGKLVVLFRRANELHLLLAALPAPAAGAASQSGGSW